MAISRLHITRLQLDRWAQIMRQPLAGFNQLFGEKAPEQTCGVWDQDEREELAWAIVQAEELISRQLQFLPSPTYSAETMSMITRGNIRADWWNGVWKTKWKYLRTFGEENLTLIKENATIAYSNSNNNPLGQKNLATITDSGLYDFFDTCSNDDPCDIKIFFRVEDGAKDVADPHYEIKPLTVDVDGEFTTIKAAAAMFVKPTLWELTPEFTLGSDDPNAWKVQFSDENFVTHVDVYCRTTDPTNAVTFYLDDLCSDDCTFTTDSGCVKIIDPVRGHFQMIPDNCGFGFDWTRVAKVDLKYLAGFPITENVCLMDQLLENAITSLATVLMPDIPCDFCDLAKHKWDDMREVLEPATEESVNIPWPGLNQKGALNAWRIVKQMAH